MTHDACYSAVPSLSDVPSLTFKEAESTMDSRRDHEHPLPGWLSSLINHVELDPVATETCLILSQS